MSTKDPKRLGAVVKDRREELGLSQMEVWNRGGPSNSTLTTIENGRALDLTPATAKKLDAGLGWQQGSALKFWREGVLPSPVDPAIEAGPIGRVLGVDAVIRSRSQRRGTGFEGWVEGLAQRLEELEERVSALEVQGGDGDDQDDDDRATAPTRSPSPDDEGPGSVAASLPTIGQRERRVGQPMRRAARKDDEK